MRDSSSDDFPGIADESSRTIPTAAGIMPCIRAITALRAGVHSLRPVVNFRFMKSTCVSMVVGAWRPMACAALILMTAGCGEDFPGRYHYQRGGGPDGGTCANYGQGGNACNCADQPYVLGVSLALDSNGGLTDLDVDLFCQDQVAAGVSANPPDKGTPGADAYYVATLVTADGTAQSSFVFANPLAWADAGYARHGHVGFTLPLVPGTATLRLENWDSGIDLIDLDVRGHVQLLCIDRPCLAICQAPDGGADSPSAAALDAGAIDAF